MSSINGLKVNPRIRFRNKNSQAFVDLQLCKIKDITIPSGYKNKENKEYKSYSISNSHGFVPQEEQFEGGNLANADKSLYIVVSPKSFAYNPARINVGSFGYQNLAYDVIVSSLYEVFKTKDNCVDSYLLQFMSTYKFNQMVQKYAEGGVRQYLFYNNFCRIPLYLPCIEEQKVISLFLSLIDEKIRKQEQLVNNLKKYKRGLFQMIFERNLGLYNSDIWSKKQLGEIFIERLERANGNEELLSVTINEGVKKRSEIDGKDNSSNDKTKYKKVYKNDIVYNTMRMWQGSSGLSSYNGIVSPAYTVISIIGDNDPEFFSYYFKYYKLIKMFQKHSQGLTSDTWNLKYPAFSKISILVPSLKTQNEIVLILKKFDSIITYNESVLNNINEMNKVMENKFSIIFKR